MNYYVLSIALWAFSGVCLLIIVRQRREAWQHAACLSIAEGAPGWETPTDDDSPAMIAVRAQRTALADLNHTKADSPFCGVCGPPVKVWWPIHFNICSNQNDPSAYRGPTPVGLGRLPVRTSHEPPYGPGEEVQP